MDKTKRPLSPHLQIYRPQLTSVLSITHRATGMLLGLCALALCFWLLAVAAGAGPYTALMQHLGAWYGRVLIGCALFSLYYHLCNGLRHLFWDAGLGLEIRTTYLSGYAVIATSVALSLATLLLGARA